MQYFALITNVAETWLTDIEVLFDTLSSTNKQKVHYIGLKLSRKMVDLKEGIAFRTHKIDHGTI
jgi:hypothetical protein